MKVTLVWSLELTNPCCVSIKTVSARDNGSSCWKLPTRLWEIWGRRHRKLEAVPFSWQIQVEVGAVVNIQRHLSVRMSNVAQKWHCGQVTTFVSYCYTKLISMSRIDIDCTYCKYTTEIRSGRYMVVHAESWWLSVHSVEWFDYPTKKSPYR